MELCGGAGICPAEKQMQVAMRRAHSTGPVSQSVSTESSVGEFLEGDGASCSLAGAGAFHWAPGGGAGQQQPSTLNSIQFQWNGLN